MCTPNVAAQLIIGGISTATNIIFENKERRERNNQLYREAKQNMILAAEERQTATENARKEKLKSILKMGEINSKTAAGNISVFSKKTSLELDYENSFGELEALSILNKGEQRAKQYDLSRDKLLSEAKTNNINFLKRSSNKIFNLGTKLSKEANKNE